jgi:hypothetical protein
MAITISGYEDAIARLLENMARCQYPISLTLAIDNNSRSPRLPLNADGNTSQSALDWGGDGDRYLYLPRPTQPKAEDKQTPEPHCHLSFSQRLEI